MRILKAAQAYELYLAFGGGDGAAMAWVAERHAPVALRERLEALMRRASRAPEAPALPVRSGG